MASISASEEPLQAALSMVTAIEIADASVISTEAVAEHWLASVTTTL